MNTVIFDIDGTLADLTHRLHYVKNGNNRWDEFFKACVDDKPIQAVVDLCIVLQKQEVFSPINIILVSGRSDISRDETEAWLLRHHISYSQLIMRPAGDYIPDHKLKEQILDKLLAEGHKILFVVDDRQRVVDMWRRRGLVCLQAAAWEEDVFFQSEQPKKGLLTLMVGPSGSGKSSFLYDRYMSSLNPTAITYNIHPYDVISSDVIRHDLCGNFRDQSKNAEVFNAIHKLAKMRIDLGLPTVIDATNIKRADRVKAVELASGGKVRYIVIDRPMEEKVRDGGWRNTLGFDLLKKHQDTFNSNLKDILKGDGFSNVEVIDLRKA